MNPDTTDSRLHATPPEPPQLDDGFSPPQAPASVAPADPVPEVLPVDPALWAKSAF